MGFVLWIERDLAWAAGTYEYRALGAAVIAKTDLFRASDFRKDRLPPRASEPSYVGHFASMEHVNDYLSHTVRDRFGVGRGANRQRRKHARR